MREIGCSCREFPHSVLPREAPFRVTSSPRRRLAAYWNKSPILLRDRFAGTNSAGCCTAQQWWGGGRPFTGCSGLFLLTGADLLGRIRGGLASTEQRRRRRPLSGHVEREAEQRAPMLPRRRWLIWTRPSLLPLLASSVCLLTCALFSTTRTLCQQSQRKHPIGKGERARPPKAESGRCAYSGSKLTATKKPLCL